MNSFVSTDYGFKTLMQIEWFWINTCDEKYNTRIQYIFIKKHLLQSVGYRPVSKQLSALVNGHLRLTTSESLYTK
jgi:hypothetical protein